jgi:bla regulator protein BlaR1
MKLFPAILAAVSIGVFVPVIGAQTSRTSHSSYSYNTAARKYNFALVTTDGTVASWGNWDTFKELKDRAKQDTLYVKKGEDLYAITDRATVDAAKRALEPMQRLGKQQGELGRQQGELGREQGKLGKKQGEYGREMGKAARDHEASEQLKELSKQMAALGKDQAELGKKQSALGSKQAELGKQQAEAGKEADAAITKLIDDAFAHGLAKKV